MTDSRNVFKKIVVLPDWVNGHFIQWTLNPFFKGERPYNFSLEISETSDFSEIVAVKENLGEVFFAVDDTKLKQSWGPNYFYRLKLITSDKKRYYSSAVLFGASNQDQRRYAMAAELIRKEILLCRFSGTAAWLLRRKSYGAVSKKTLMNLDPVSGVPITDTPDEDYGVGIDEGYFNPVPCTFFTDQSSQDKQLDQNGIGVKETYTGMIRMPGYPILEVRDIICDAQDGTRYSIQSRNAKQFPGTNIVIMQKANINLIPPTDTIYSIPIPAAL